VDFKYAFEIHARLGLRLTSHAGNGVGPKEVRYRGPKLIGVRAEFGPTAFNRSKTMALVYGIGREKIVLEVCPGIERVLGCENAGRITPIRAICERVRSTVSTMIRRSLSHHNDYELLTCWPKTFVGLRSFHTLNHATCPAEACVFARDKPALGC